MSGSGVQFEFEGCRVLVTGATTGIGRSVAEGFVSAGASVVITGTKQSADGYDSLPKGCEYLPLDLSSSEDISGLGKHIDRLDVLVNNAGGNRVPENFELAVEVNLTAVHKVNLALVDALSRSNCSHGASIVNIASMMSFKGSRASPGYAAAKAGILTLTQSEAALWAEQNVRVNAVAPGAIRTGMTSVWANDEVIGPATASLAALGRWGEPKDLVGPIMFLCSPAAGFVTGAVLRVCGGFQISD